MDMYKVIGEIIIIKRTLYNLPYLGYITINSFSRQIFENQP
jgi:hypothetical protein